MNLKNIFFVLVLLSPIALGETTIVINGKTIHTSSSNISVNNNTVIIDGKIQPNNTIVGSAVISSENRNLAAFKSLRLEINAEVYVVKGEMAQCIVTADDNIVPIIQTESEGSVLRIFTEKIYSSKHGVKIKLITPILKKVENNASGKIQLAEVLKNNADLVINGSGNIIAIGRINNLVATLNGSGHLGAKKLEAKTVTIFLNGSGNAGVHATASLSAKLNGSGDIRYFGTPQKVFTSINGSGRISKSD